MYSVSSELAAALAEQPLLPRVTVGNLVLEAGQILNLNYSASCGGEEILTIGGISAATVSLTVMGRRELLDELLTVEVGTRMGDTVEYLPLGTFAVTECRMGENSTTVTGFDAAYSGMGRTYVPTVSEGATVAAVLADVAAQCGLTLAALPDLAGSTVVAGDDLTGRTCREMAGLAAALVGCNVLIDRTGALALRWFAYSDGRVTSEEFYAGTLTLDGTFRLGFIACTVPVRSTVESITSRVLRVGSGSTGISIQNPYMTQRILDAIWLHIGGKLFYTGSYSMVGGLLLEPGDMVLMRERDGTSYRFPIQTLELTVDGGCRATIRAEGISGTETAANVTGSVTGALRSMASDAAAANAQNQAQFTQLQTRVNTLQAEKASVTDLQATNAQVSNLSAVKADVTDLQATNASVASLSAQKANVTELQATNAAVSNLSAGKADVDLANIQAGCITTAMLGNGVVGTAQIADASVTDGKIVGLTANKITAGTLDAGTIDVVNLNAANITVGTINGAQIAQGAISAGNLDSALNQAITSSGTNADEALRQAGLAVTTAQSASSTANSAVSIANGKTTAYYAAAQPGGSGFQVNDIWFDTDDGNKMYRWDGSAWAAAQYGAGAISSAAITADKLAASAVTAGKIASGAVTADSIAANAVVAGKLATNAVTTGALAAGAVTAQKIAAGAVSADHLTAGAVTSDKIVAGAVTTAKLDAEAVNANKIAAGAVTTAKLDAGAVTTAKLDAGAVTAAKLAAGAVTTEKLAAGAVTADKIDVTDLFARNITGVYTTSSTDSSTGAEVTTEASNSFYLNDAGEIALRSMYTKTVDGIVVLTTGSRLLIEGSLLRLISTNITLAANRITVSTTPQTNTYTQFDSPYISDGWVTVVEKLGWCQVFGVLVLTQTLADDWSLVLDSSKVPAPQHGRNIYQTSSNWNDVHKRTARIRILSTGGLYVRQGADYEVNFSITYPVV